MLTDIGARILRLLPAETAHRTTIRLVGAAESILPKPLADDPRLQRFGALRRVELAVAVLVEALHHPLDVLILEARDLAQLPGVAIAGQVYTPNAGIERIVANLNANPAIRFLLLCGRDSKLFLPGQSLSAEPAAVVDAQVNNLDLKAEALEREGTP